MLKLPTPDMSGKRQHYLPQFVQRGFASATDGTRTWYYRRTAMPKEVGIRDVGVEDYFYSDSSDTTLDASITALESEEFGSAIQQIRNGRLGPISTLDMPKLVAHLEVRSRHLRAGFTESCEMLWDITVELLKQPELLAGLFQSRYRRDPTSIVREAENQLRVRNLPTEFAEEIAQRAAASLTTPSSEFFAPFWGFVLPMAETIFKPKLREAVKNAHQDALKKSISPAVRAKQYEHLVFQSVDITSNDLILGDSAVIFDVGNGDFKAFADKDDEIQSIFLPLSPRCLVIGARSNVESDIDREVRQQIARCSHNSFIAAELSDANAALMREIGRAALPLSTDQLREIVDEVLGDALVC
jgi:hypothetical protein